MLEEININRYSDHLKKYQKTLTANIWLFLNCFERTKRELFEKKFEINELISLYECKQEISAQAQWKDTNKTLAHGKRIHFACVYK